MTQSRFDIYKPIHKAFRMIMGETLVAVGRADPEDPASVDETLARVRELIDLCEMHVADENAFIHPAILARDPGFALATVADHDHHTADFVELRALVEAVGRAGTAERAGGLHRLYRRLAVFVGDNLLHMEVEETANNGALWRLYSDEELRRLDHELVQSLPPEAAMKGVRLILLAATPADRAEMLAHIRAGAPAAVFEAILEGIRDALSPLDRQKLHQCLDRLDRAA
ncbi:MAG: hemerythrin domain-containing protein [Azospirillaceae bacterium]